MATEIINTSIRTSGNFPYRLSRRFTRFFDTGRFSKIFPMLCFFLKKKHPRCQLRCNVKIRGRKTKQTSENFAHSVFIVVDAVAKVAKVVQKSIVHAAAEIAHPKLFSRLDRLRNRPNVRAWQISMFRGQLPNYFDTIIRTLKTAAQ